MRNGVSYGMRDCDRDSSAAVSLSRPTGKTDLKIIFEGARKELTHLLHGWTKPIAALQ